MLLGVAEGSDLPFSTVLALNVRTEISMGMMTDGCTSLAWRSDEFSVLAQNWDVRFHQFGLLKISKPFANVLFSGRIFSKKISLSSISNE